MAPAIAPQLGFLTIFQEALGFQGGFLVTNSWGRPLEFRLSSAVAPNRVQQILYGSTLEEYLCADLIGKTLLEKTATAIHLLVTDNVGALALRSRIAVPVLYLHLGEHAPTSERRLANHAHASSSGVLYREAALEHDATAIDDLLAGIDPSYDLAEPFSRIREAMTEARRMGGSTRGAA